jgi:cell division septation protein DedD
MRKIFLPLGLIAAFLIAPAILRAQSDKDIIKEANADIKNKAYDLAFQKIITVSQPEKKKAQEVLKSCYPNLIADYLSKASAIKLSDKDSLNVKREKLEQIISYLNDGLIADSILKKLAEPGMYKSVSKKKKIESTMKNTTSKLKTIIDIIAKKEQEAKANDTLAKDTVQQTQLQPQTQTQIQSQTQTPADNNNFNQPVNNTQVNANTSETVANTSTTPSGDKKYFIIAGSYKTEADAQVAVNNLKDMGYSSSEIVGQNAYGSFRICYSSFVSKDQATSELEKIRQIQTDAWILEK